MIAASCPGPTADSARLVAGEDGSPWLVMTLPDGGQNPTDHITAMLAGFAEPDRAALAVYCSAWSSYTDSLTAPSRTAAGMGLAA